MSDYWRLSGEGSLETPPAGASSSTGESVRKQQITVRLDAGMIEDAREIALRKGIGHHTLLRMWVMEGIVRAYQEGVLAHPPRAWSEGHVAPPRPARQRQPRVTAQAAQPTPQDAAGPSGARWLRRGNSRQ